MPANSRILKHVEHRELPGGIKAIAANEVSLRSTYKTLLPLSFIGVPTTHQVNIYLLDDCDTILGHDVIIGLDVIKKAGLCITRQSDRMVAMINGTIVAQETPRTTAILAAQAREYPPKVRELLNRYGDIFSESATSFMKVSPMRIPLTCNSFAKAKLRRHEIADIIEMKKQTDKLVANDVIEPSISPFSSNAHLVPKKNGTKRMVINFIPLNRIAIEDHYPIPQIHDLFHTLRNAKMFTALDCTEGFFQIPVHPDDRHKTAFITPHGLFQFKRCPFGFTNSPAVFQRAMNSIFEDGLYRRCVIYIDDIMIFGKNMAELTDNTEWVFNRCREAHVQLKLSKCQFAQTTVEFLGHLL